MNEVDKRLEHLQLIQEVIDEIITSKTSIDSIAVCFDYTDQNTDDIIGAYSWRGNHNSIVGMLSKFLESERKI